jgi:hypothetical protein
MTNQIHRIQALRKEAGLNKNDNISLFIKADEDLINMLNDWENNIKEKVGAKHIKISSLNPGRKHKYNNKEKVKTESFELFFDKV